VTGTVGIAPTARRQLCIHRQLHIQTNLAVNSRSMQVPVAIVWGLRPKSSAALPNATKVTIADGPQMKRMARFTDVRLTAKRSANIDLRTTFPR